MMWFRRKRKKEKISGGFILDLEETENNDQL